ncbi:hypothetical protein EC973_004890 [Apophysomyces ossiformis]|uniref:Enoyl reductase (ER) domain-containing protein n=1 Tax=Apophysomyces ossiformis TaxID=679940 RepID=A0A8H7BPP1_9FUNG|nr:hypothetical protein EC973_004890 [Apophysomyces ossiformis]
MRAVIIKEPGDATQLYIGEIPRPTPTDTQVLVKTKCFALNRMDIVQRQGFYPPPPGASETLGVEISGIVESIGKNGEIMNKNITKKLTQWFPVTKFKPGDAVFGLMPGGGYAEYAVIEETLTMLKPEALSFEQAAAIPETWFTAYQALFFVAELKPGQDVLIHAGASGVGIAAIQLAKQHGARRIFVTVGSDEKCRFCEELGATNAINYKTEDWARLIAEETSQRGVDIVIDFIGKNYWHQNVESLAIDGRMVILAFMSGYEIEKADLRPLLKKRLRIEASSLRSRSLDYQGRLRDALYEDVILGHLAKKDGTLKLFIDRAFDWHDIVKCHEYLESNQSMGKIVVQVV